MKREQKNTKAGGPIEFKRVREVEVPARSAKRRRISPLVEDAAGISMTVKAGDLFNKAADWDLEQAYQRKSSKQKKGKESTRLPIKTAEGKVEQLQPTELSEDELDSFLGTDNEEDAEDTAATEDSEAEGPKLSEKEQIVQAKEELARLATLINEDPEEHSGSFRALAHIATSAKNNTVRKLALATQAAVYKDVIPGYRIRAYKEDDLGSRVSKEVRKTRQYEQSLLSGYQNYVKHLAVCARPGERGDASLRLVAINCVCTLLTSVPHFNFRGDLLKVVVDQVAKRETSPELVKCLSTLGSFFAEDTDGGASLEAVQILTKMMRAKDYRVDESVLNTLFHLRLLSELAPATTDTTADRPTFKGKRLKEKRQHRSKAQRKVDKERREVEKDMKEADATVSHEERDRMQSETLKLVFATYFRILKLRVPHLMGAVLEGLAKYAHLINQDFFGDLLEALNDLITQSSTLDEDEDDTTETETDNRNLTREALLCTITAFALLEGQDASKAASSLHLDLSFFVSHTYRALYPLCLDPDIELGPKSFRLPDPSSTSPKPRVNLLTPTVLLVRTLISILLTTRPSPPPLRLAAFTKRLATSTLQLPEKSTLATIDLLTKVAKQHARKIAPLFNTEERRGDGVFDPLSAEAEGSNVFAATVWEGEVLRKHFAPGVREGWLALEQAIVDTA